MCADTTAQSEPTTCLKIHAVVLSRVIVSLRRAASPATLFKCQSRSSAISFTEPTIVEVVDDMGQPLDYAYDCRVELEEFRGGAILY